MKFDITSFQNPHIKQLKSLKDKKCRDETGRFRIEGYREILRAYQKNIAIEELFFCSEFFLGENERSLMDAIKKTAPIFHLPKQLFEKISYRDRPDGLICIAKKMPSQSLREFLRKLTNPFLLVVESIEKPGNLGSMLRSSDAVGAHAVIVCDPLTDIYNPNVIRSSIGTLFSVPVFEISSDEALSLLKELGIKIIAATPSAKLEFTKADLKGNIALAVGTEQLGLSEKWMKEADLRVKIPMKGIADSLNVANAATLLLYEILRQRDEGSLSR